MTTFESQLRTSRRLAFAACAALLVVVVVATFGVLALFRLANDNAESLHILRARAAADDRLVVRVDCNNRRATQDVLDRLEREGVLEPGQASIVGSACDPNPTPHSED